MDEVPIKQSSLLLPAANLITKGPRLRTRAFIPMAIALLWMAALHPINYWGIAITSVGELLRLWASGHLDKGGASLTTTGPYAFCRNPLYLGSSLVGIGLTLAVHPHWLVLITIVLAIGLHRVTILYEESRLKGRYGEAFLEYCNHVPPFLPRLRAWQGNQNAKFDWQRLRLNYELPRVIWILVFILVMVLLSWWQPLGK